MRLNSARSILARLWYSCAVRVVQLRQQLSAAVRQQAVDLVRLGSSGGR